MAISHMVRTEDSSFKRFGFLLQSRSFDAFHAEFGWSGVISGVLLKKLFAHKTMWNPVTGLFLAQCQFIVSRS